MMGTRPQTLYGFADSPVGLAAVMLDHGADWLSRPGQHGPRWTSPGRAPHARRHPGQRHAFLADEYRGLLATLSWENKLPLLRLKGVSVPVAVSTFADELYQVPRSWAEQAYPDLISTTSTTRAGTSRPGSSRSCSRQTSARLPIAR